MAQNIVTGIMISLLLVFFISIVVTSFLADERRDKRRAEHDKRMFELQRETEEARRDYYKRLERMQK